MTGRFHVQKEKKLKKAVQQNTMSPCLLSTSSAQVPVKKCLCNKEVFKRNTRMHSSRLRTGRS